MDGRVESQWTTACILAQSIGQRELNPKGRGSNFHPSAHTRTEALSVYGPIYATYATLRWILGNKALHFTL